MKKKIAVGFGIATTAIVTYFAGVISASLSYKVALAGCRPAQINKESFDEFEMSEYTNKLINNFYSSKYSFGTMLVPKNIAFKDYYQNFNNGGFHYFETDQEETVICGLFK